MPWIERTFSFDFPIGVFPGIVERLRGTPARIQTLISGLSDEALSAQPSGGWSIKQHIGHLDDLDSLDHKRLSEFLDRKPQLSAADMTNRKTHESGYNDRTAVDLLLTFRNHRNDLVQKLDALDEAAVAVTAMHPRLQVPMRLVDWTYFVAEHDDHHVARIRELLAPAS